MDKFLDNVAENLRVELDDLSTLARQLNETGFNQQCSYLMGWVRMLVIARETGTDSATPTEYQIRASGMAMAVQNAIFAAREHLTRRLADARNGKFT